MKGGFHLEMGTGQRIDGDLESGLQGGAIRADVKGDGIERGHWSNYQLSIINYQIMINFQ